MKTLRLYKNLYKIATSEFKTIVESGNIFYFQNKDVPWKLRLFLCDNSFIDIYYSVSGKYSFHWDRRLNLNKIYRHDNAPHRKWKGISTFPKHFHNGSEETVEPSYIADNPESSLRQFLTFVMKHLLKT